MTPPPTTAIILAAGMGTRLRDVHSGAPKGLLRIDGETLVERSLRLLRQAGIERVILVTGYRAEDYAPLPARWPELELIHNGGYEDNGSMASMALALIALREDEDFLVLESDLFYEARALTVLLASVHRDVVLTSGPTGAGDEVWVQTQHGVLETMSKNRKAVECHGEFVGICRLSAPTGQAMETSYRAFVDRHGHGRMSYETDALLQVSHPITVHQEPSLLWGEIDNADHYTRVLEHLAPKIRAKAQSAASEV